MPDGGGEAKEPRGERANAGQRRVRRASRGDGFVPRRRVGGGESGGDARRVIARRRQFRSERVDARVVRLDQFLLALHLARQSFRLLFASFALDGGGGVGGFLGAFFRALAKRRHRRRETRVFLPQKFELRVRVGGFWRRLGDSLGLRDGGVEFSLEVHDVPFLSRRVRATISRLGLRLRQSTLERLGARALFTKRLRRRLCLRAHALETVRLVSRALLALLSLREF